MIAALTVGGGVRPGLVLPDWVPDLPSVPWPEAPSVPGLVPSQYLVLIPLVAALLAFVVTRRSRAVAWVTIPAWLVTAGLAAYVAYDRAVSPLPPGSVATRDGTIPPPALGDLDLPLHLSLDRVGVLLAAVVALVTLCVQVYARWFLWFDPRYRQFAATTSLLGAAMLLLVVSGDLLLILVGWQIMGWCAYLLIGHVSTREGANRAATKTFVVSRLADLGFVIGVLVLVVGAGSSDLARVLDYWSGPGAGSTALTVALIGLVVGVAGASAQVPFQDWLPDSTAAPTPAAALIHAATMVVAGTVVLIRVLPLLATDDVARTVLALLAAVSVLLGALLAFAQPDLKRMLAWSTVSQTGLLLGGVALQTPALAQTPDAVLAHLGAHGLFRALLFLALGWLSVLTGGTLVRNVVGGARLFSSVRRPLALGLLSLAGVPPLVGFISREALLQEARDGLAGSGGFAVAIVLGAIGASIPLTAAYCMRAWLIVRHGRSASDPGEEARPQRRGGPIIDDFFDEPEVVVEAQGLEEAEAAIASSARLSIFVLGVLTVLGGLLLLTPLLEVPFDPIAEWPAMALSLGLVIAAALAVWGASRGVRVRDAALRLPRGLARSAERGLDVDSLYTGAVTRPVGAAARGVVWAERDVIDAYVRSTATLTRLAGLAAEAARTTRSASALLVLAGGAVLLVVVGVVLW